MVKKTHNPFVDKRNCTVYRIVHNQQGDVAEGTAPVGGTLQMVYGETDYFPEETAKLEAQYMEELKQKARAAGAVPGQDGWDDEEYEEYEEGSGEEWDEEDEDGWDDEAGTMKLDRSEMTQLERDIDELGLPDDGYDYTSHLRNPGQGVFLSAHVSREQEEVNRRREEAKARTMTKAAKEVLQLLEDDDEEEEEEEEEDDDDAPPPLDEESEAGAGGQHAKAAEGKGEGKEEKGGKPVLSKIEVEGDLPDDLLGYLNGGDDEYEYEEGEWEAPPQTLLDERFEVMMGKYSDELVGELDDDHPGLVPPGAGTAESYYALLDQYISMGKASAESTKPEFMEGKNQMVPTETYFEQIQEDEEEERDLVERTRALIVTQDQEQSVEKGDFEEVVVEEREQWDCESILSTYSNIYNRPSIVFDGKDKRKIKLHPVTGAPILKSQKEEEEGECEEEDEEGEEEEVGSKEVIMIDKRVRGESAEDKKARKELAKQVKAAALEKKKAKALAAGAARGKPVIGGADPRTRPGLSVVRYVA